jgi:hypothetical protein
MARPQASSSARSLLVGIASTFAAPAIGRLANRCGAGAR